MQEQVNKHIEKLTDKMLGETSIESPSFDFTAAVMSQVESLENSSITAYKPLIPKYLWFVVGFALILITGYLFVNNTGSEASLLSNLDFSKITNNTITQSVSEFKMPKTFMYAILFLGLMICVQVPVLKNYFDKRLSV